MCGILALLGEQKISHETFGTIINFIDARGPDFQSHQQDLLKSCGLRLKLKCSILHLRGLDMQIQPLIDDPGNFLMFNGQIYSYDNRVIDETKSDTTFLFERLNDCSSMPDIADVCSLIDGPFAVIYWNEKLRCLVYGRDLFGRKSLCSLQTAQGRLPHILSSSGYQDSQQAQSNHLTWTEVDCSGLHCFQYDHSGEFVYKLFEWNLDQIYRPSKKCAQSRDSVSYRLVRSPLLPLNYDLRLSDCFSLSEQVSVLNTLEEKLILAIAKRVTYNRKDCLVCRKSNKLSLSCKHAKYSIAFSGGIDSVLIAYAMHKVIDEQESIDLITVAFREDSPDRLSANEAFQELRNLCQKRIWRLVLCDIDLEELQTQRTNCIRHLIHPCTTVVDDSLGCACWFIGRAEGRAIESSDLRHDLKDFRESITKFSPNAGLDESLLYKSPATMLFVGSGIDEQLGGYSSHRAAWSSGGTEQLLEEISFQMRRLSKRNLGRDDRVYSYHGRDVKLPYLDYDLVSYLNQLPVSLKMSLDAPLDTGPKKLLRDLALKWGLDDTARRVKRAMQFGTRIANLEGKKEKGSDICTRLV